MRRLTEVLILIAFLGAGVLTVTGNLPLPRLKTGSVSFGPVEAAVESTSRCASCSAECPLAGGQGHEDAAGGTAADSANPVDIARVPVGGELFNRSALPGTIPGVADLPLSGGVMTDARHTVANGRVRAWIHIATSSSVEEAARWYKNNLADAEWELLEDQPAIAPNAVFLSFQRDEATLNVFFERREELTRIFVDYPEDG